MDHDYSVLLTAAQSGDTDAERRFCELVNVELRRLARGLARFSNEDQPTSLVNELYLRLFRGGAVRDLKNRRYFFAVAIDQMRQILRERIKKRTRAIRGGDRRRVPLDTVIDDYLDDFRSRNRFGFEALDDALERLRENPATRRQSEVVRLRFLVGFTVAETAKLLRVSERTVASDWRLARAKLRAEMLC